MAENQFGLSRHITSGVKREVRRRCGFGCVVCGNAIIQYEHFNPEFEFAKTHVASGITLLCPNHHEQKKKGLLTNEQIKKCDADAEAVKVGFALHTFQNTFAPEVILGQKIFAGGTSVIRINGQVILGFKGPESSGAPARLSFSFSDRNGVEVFSVLDNEIVCENETYDIESKGNTWKIRSGHRKIDLQIKFDLPTRITVEKMNFRRKHWGLLVNGPKFDLTFDGETTIEMTGLVKIVAPCLYDLAEDSASISSRDGVLTGGVPPSPLGSKPGASGNGYSIDWPVLCIFDEDTNKPLVHSVNGTDVIGIFLRSHDANKTVSSSQRVLELTQEQCGMLIKYMSEQMSVGKVMFNPGIETLPFNSNSSDFLSNIGAEGGVRRNGKCFCGSEDRFEHCHGQNLFV